MQVEKLLEQYDNIAVALPEARALQEKHAAAAAWAAQAQKALDRPQPFRDEDAARLQVCRHAQDQLWGSRGSPETEGMDRALELWGHNMKAP